MEKPYLFKLLEWVLFLGIGLMAAAVLAGTVIICVALIAQWFFNLF